MEGYTLISSIGTGMYKKEGGYRDTVYQFPNGKKWPTKIFLKAILEAEYYRPIKKVILAGTTSSSWDVLIPPDADAGFWSKILDECERNVFSDASKKELESKLSEWNNNIKFEIVLHTNEFTLENVENVFNKYLEIPGLLEPETNILFDITHGFRSMPLLIFQSLQLNARDIYGRKIELVYGEYIEEEKISHVRDLSEYWDYYEISSAIKLFEESFDGKQLADKISGHWESGAKFLKRFSEIVECNFSLQLPEALKQLKNALAGYNETGKPQWVNDVRNKLAGIFKELHQEAGEKYPVSKTVWEYSKLLRKKNLVTQAVIALQVVPETAVAEKYDPSKIGDFSWFNGYYDEKKSKKIEGTGDAKLKEIRKRNQKLSCSLGQIERLRNQIAHGGGKDSKGNYPHQANIPGILKPIDDMIEIFFTELDGE